MKSIHLLIPLGFLYIAACTSAVGIEKFHSIHDLANDDLLTDQQKEITSHNAKYLAFEYQFRKDSTFIDVDPELIEFYYDALTIILTSAEGRSKPVIQNLSHFNYQNIHKVVIALEETAPFIEQWNNLEIETGISDIDELLFDKGFIIEEVQEIVSTKYYELWRESAINTIYISKQLSDLPYINVASPSYRCCDGPKIKAEHRKNNILFRFIFSYGDCPAGCIHDTSYLFSINTVGEVLFHGIEEN